MKLNRGWNAVIWTAAALVFVADVAINVVLGNPFAAVVFALFAAMCGTNVGVQLTMRALDNNLLLPPPRK